MARKMKDSGIEWIGEIPEGWEIHRIKTHFSIISGSGFKPELQGQSTGDFPVCKASDISSSGHYLHTSANYITSDIVKSQHFSIIPKGSILFAKIGEAMRKNNRSLCSLDCCVDNNCQGLVPKNISSEFSYYLFTCIDMTWFDNAGTIPCINNQKLYDCRIPFPSYGEQTLIANHLNIQCAKINEMLFHIRSSIEEYKKLKQAVITQAVTKGVRGEREMKNSGVEWIGEIPKEWVCEKIKYATSISRGLFNHRPRNDERYYNGKYPFIQTGDVANATKYIVSYSQTLNELGKSVSKEFPKGTLTMTIAANVGDVAILNFDAYFPDSVVGFVPNKNIRTLYLFYVFSAMKDEFIRTAIKSTQLNLNIDRVKETFIPVTLNVNEQCEIENYLESKCAEIDELIAKKEQLVKELESYKKSLIYEVVTGKREV